MRNEKPDPEYWLKYSKVYWTATILTNPTSSSIYGLSTLSSLSFAIDPRPAITLLRKFAIKKQILSNNSRSAYANETVSNGRWSENFYWHRWMFKLINIPVAMAAKQHSFYGTRTGCRGKNITCGGVRRWSNWGWDLLVTLFSLVNYRESIGP